MSSAALVAALRDLPDDWPTWLVLADVLDEAGDERGELLVLEQRGEPILERALAWADSWCAYLADDDVGTFRWLARLSSIAWRAPADLAPVYGQPLSQLLALVELAVDPPPPLSRVFALQRDRILAATRRWIDRAFDGVPVPDEHHRTLRQAAAADRDETCDRSRDHLGRWQDLPEAQLVENRWALPHLDEQGIPYYVPAVMTYVLRHDVSRFDIDGLLAETLAFTLAPSGGRQQQRFAPFDREQRAAIYAFVLVTGTEEAREAWGRVVEAERTGPRADWFEIYAPR